MCLDQEKVYRYKTYVLDNVIRDMNQSQYFPLQFVPTTKSWTKATVTQLTKGLPNVTAQLEKAGTDSWEMQAHRCQLSAFLNISVVPMHRAGWVAHIPRWGREPFNAKCVSIGHRAAVSGPVISRFVIAGVSFCTSWIGHQPAVCDFVERNLKVGNSLEHEFFFLHADSSL